MPKGYKCASQKKMYRESFLGHNSRRSMEPLSRGKGKLAAEKLNIPLLIFCWLACVGGNCQSHDLAPPRLAPARAFFACVAWVTILQYWF